MVDKKVRLSLITNSQEVTIFLGEAIGLTGIIDNLSHDITST